MLRHILLVNRDNDKGLHWFVCAMDYKVPFWTFKVWTWEPYLGTSLVWPMWECLCQNGVSTHERALVSTHMHKHLTFTPLLRVMSKAEH